MANFPKIGASSKSGGKDFELVPPGVRFAICREVIHLGVQPSTGPFPPKDKVYFGFEIPSVRVKWEKDGKEMEGPAKIGTQFTLSLSDKSLLKPFLVSWRGKPFTAEEEADFDVTKMIGKVCQLSVVHTQKGDKTYANISGAFELSEEQKDDIRANPAKAKPSMDLLVYTPDAHNQAAFDRVPKWLQDKIKNRIIEKPIAANPGAIEGEFDDDIPF